MAQLVKTISGLAIASCKTVDGLDIASVKTILGLDNTSAGGGSVTIDASAKNGTGDFNGGGLNQSQLTITVASNSNRAMYVFVCGGAGGGGVEDVSTVSSNVDGVFTNIGTATDSNFCYVDVWRKTAPSTGAHTITATFSSFATTDCALFAISLYNVNQTTPEDTLVTNSGSSAAPSASGTLASTDMAVAALMSDDNAGIAVTTGTERQEIENIGGGGDTSGSLATNTGSGSISITWSQDNTGWAVAYAPVNSA